MKTFKLILAAMLLVSTTAIAKTSPQPDYLKNGKITVELEDGTKYTFSSNTHAVVLRNDNESEESCSNCEKAVAQMVEQLEEASRPNAIKIYGGYGPNGLSDEVDNSNATVRQKYGLNYGLGYGRLFGERYTFDGVLLMNKGGAQGGLLGVGYRW